VDLSGIVRRIDAAQQRRPFLAFPFGVIKKFGDDQAGNLAALIAYYGFFSLFPLLLVMVSVIGLLVRGNPELQSSILSSALRNFPVIGTDIEKNLGSITGNGAALAVGIVGTLWAGLGVTQSAQNAMNTVWNVPRKDWPNFLKSRLRSLIMLAILGSITLVSAVTSAFGASESAATLLKVGGVAAGFVLNLALFLISYRVLTVKDLRWRDVLPGAVVAAVLWTLMLSLGGYYLTRRLEGATNTFGTFAVVIGLLVWLYLGAQITLFCAEINVVRVLRLWPRSLTAPPFTQGDEDTLRGQAKQQQLHPQEDIEVTFGDGAEDGVDAEAGAGKNSGRPRTG
jgi:YihY family inner membrane protein